MPRKNAWLTKMRGNKMIDEYWTWEFYGYHSDELKPKSHKPIVVRCDECCQYRIVHKYNYRDFCRPCGLTGRKMPSLSQERIDNLVKSRKTDEARANISKSLKGKTCPDEARAKISKAQKGKKKPPRTDEHRRKISASKQGIDIEDWDGFVREDPYCEKFDEACKERIRAKCDYRCFLCNKHQDENITKNGKQIALSVHHYDMNKDAGCNGNEWKLIPLCMHCHPSAHSEPMKSRIEYIID